MNGSTQNGDNPDQGEDVSGQGLSERRAQLNRKLDDQRTAEETARLKSQGNSTGYGQAAKLSSEFIAGVLVGAVIGWVFDQWLGTGPFGLIVFLLLGFAAGVLNLLRSAGYVSEPGEGLRKAKKRGDDPN